ncbi:unnamed protein product [Victoria cruziana]
MSRRQVNPNARRYAESSTVPLSNALHQKSRSSPLLSVALILLGAFLLIAYSYSGSGGFRSEKDALIRDDGENSCTLEVLKAVPLLKKVYGDSMRHVLHVGPDTCAIVSKLLKEEDTEAWGVEPYDMEDTDGSCKALVRKGIVRVADLKFPLPYKADSFSIVIASDALDYLSPRYLNKTLPDLARVAKDGLVLFTGYPGHHRAKVPEGSKFGKPVSFLFNSYGFLIY